MSDQLTMETLGAEVRQRLDAVNTQVSDATSDERIRQMIDDNLKLFLESDSGKEHVRKLKFGSGRSDSELTGGKYARMGLTVGDIEMLHDITTAGARVGLSSGPSEELRKTFAAVSEGKYEDTAVIRSRGEQQLTDAYRAGRMSAAGYERALRAMDTAESGYGSQLVGAQYVGELWKGAEAEARVFSLIRSFDMTAPTAYLPVQATLPTVSFVSESTANNSSNYGTTKTGSNRVQVNAKKLLMHQMWSGEMEEDAIIAYLPFLREEAARSWALHLDAAILNGDTTSSGTGNINQDDEAPGGTEYFMAFDGIRHAGLVDNTANSLDVNGAIAFNTFKNQRSRMVDSTYKHDWSHPNDPSDLVYVADPDTADAISFLDEFVTLDKMGPRATVLAGQQGSVLSHPLIASIMLSKTEADGKVSYDTPSNNVKGQLVAFNRRGAVIGTRRQLKVEAERLPATDQSRLVWSTRIGMGRFAPTGAASGIEWADVLYNISL